MLIRNFKVPMSSRLAWLSVRSTSPYPLWDPPHVGLGLATFPKDPRLMASPTLLS